MLEITATAATATAATAAAATAVVIAVAVVFYWPATLSLHQGLVSLILFHINDVKPSTP